MKRKILKGALILACQFILLTGVGFASEVNEEYFKFKTFEEISSEVEGKLEKEYFEELEDAYNEAYKLEKEMKYFTADEKWSDTESLSDDLRHMIIEDYEDDEDVEEAVEKFGDYIESTIRIRDYRYGLPSFEEAYDMEFKDIVNSIPSKKRDDFKKVLEKKYEEMEVACENAIDYNKKKDKNKEKDKNKKKGRHLDEDYILGIKRKEIGNLLRYANNQQEYLVITEEDVYMIGGDLCYEPEKFYKFLKEEEVLNIIGKKNAAKLKKLMHEAYKEDRNRYKLLDNIEEMLYNLWDEKDERNFKIIDELYEELED